MREWITMIVGFTTLLLILAIPVVVFFGNIFRVVKVFFKKGKIVNIDFYNTLDVISTTLPLVATIFFFNLKGGNEAIILHGGSEIDIHAILAYEHILTIIVILVFSIISFWVLKFFSMKLSPILYLIFSSSLILEIVVIIFFFIQVKGRFDYMIVNVPAYSFANLTFAYIYLLKKMVDEFISKEKELGRIYENKLKMKLYGLLISANTLPIIMVFSIFPILLVLQFSLVIFGQQPDSFIKAFIETSDWTFSKLQAPPPIYVPTGDGHYLCTVALKGHKSLVKPIRYGIRQNRVITVNRQLLVANAFENILEEYTPKLHIIIRSFYDNHGLPICKYINSALIADYVYIIMKPLEWIFLLCLYIVDKNPENRISAQYLIKNNL